MLQIYFEIQILCFILIMRNCNVVSKLIKMNALKSRVFNILSKDWIFWNNHYFSNMAVNIAEQVFWQNEHCLNCWAFIISLNILKITQALWMIHLPNNMSWLWTTSDCNIIEPAFLLNLAWNNSFNFEFELNWFFSSC